MNPETNLTGTRMVQPAGPIEQPDVKHVTDIVYAGTEVARTIRNLPEVTSAAKPPVIQFVGVTSIMEGTVPVDTDIYTNLLRDRLVTGADNKVRYMERQLPPLQVAKKKKKKAQDISVEQAETGGNADYQVLAELQGRSEANAYRLQVQLLNVATSTVVFNSLYLIHKEEANPGAPGSAPIPGANPSPAMAAPATATPQ